MDARFYNTEDIDVQRLANDLVNVYMAQGYQTQQFGDKNQMLVQLKKGGDLEALIGMQAALSLTLQHTAGGTLAMIGHQRWLDKAAVGTIGIVAFPILWPLALTAGAGAIRQASLANQVLNVVDGLVRQQRPDAIPGPIPVQFMPQVQQQWGPAPYQQTPTYIPPQGMPGIPQPLPMPTKLRCSNCNTPYEPGDTFCTGCGRSLAPQKLTCPNCHTELKPGVAFCPKCGASTFQSATGAQAPVAPQQPASQAPYYAPPVPPVPAPKPQPKPPTSYYVPSAQAVPTPPEQPTLNPYAAPTVATPTPVPQPKPAQEPYYTPPVTQEPSVQPQPKVTLVPNANQAASAPAQAPKQPPQKRYYIPSNQEAAQAPTAQAPVQSQPIQAQSASQPAVDPNAVWGSLVFADGKQVQLKGEHAVIGRYDHDLGGIQPEVDLANTQESNTVSRVHAALEHIGSLYTLTDLNSTNATRINGKRLEPDKAMPINDGDTLSFGKITCTFKKAS